MNLVYSVVTQGAEPVRKGILPERKIIRPSLFGQRATGHLATVLLVAWLLLCASIANAAVIAGRVVAVADGDSITLLDAQNTQHKIRLGGIDAPERRQAFGNVSKTYLTKLAHGKAAEADCYKRDRYKRLICTVKVNGQDVGLAQLDAGLAWVYRQYVGELPAATQRQYREAEARARANGLGLWRDRDPVPPWEWRRAN